MGPIAKVLLGLGAALAGLAVFGKDVGDDVREFDVALVPLKRFLKGSGMPATLRQRLEAVKEGDPRLQGARLDDLSVGVRAETLGGKSFSGPMVALLRGANAGDVAKTRDQEVQGITVPRGDVVGILKRGRPISEAENQLEEGSFAA